MTPGRFQPLLVRPFDTIPDRLSFHLDGMKNPRGKIQSLVVIVKMNPVLFLWQSLPSFSSSAYKDGINLPQPPVFPLA